MAALWILALGWCLWGPAPVHPDPQPDPQMVILVHDARSGVSAGLWLGDTDSAPADVIRGASEGVWTVVDAGTGEPTAVETLGYSTGDPAASLALLARLGRPEARFQVAAQVGPFGAAMFEGSAARDVRHHFAASSVVLGRAVPRQTVQTVGRRIAAVGGDPAELLLAVAEEITGAWPHRGGPRSALLFVRGGGRAEEVIAVDYHGAISRRLIERHLVHLSINEVPHQLDRARDACPRHPDVCRAAVGALVAAARRALSAHPAEPRLLESIAEAQELRRRAKLR